MIEGMNLGGFEINYIDISEEIQDIKNNIEFMENSLKQITTGNLSHKKSGLVNAVSQLNKIIKEIEDKQNL